MVAEYVRWRSPEDLGAAFTRPEFREHMSVVESIAGHPVLAFGEPNAGELILTPGHAYTMTILGSSGQPDGLRSIEGALLHVDRSSGSAFLLGPASTTDPPAARVGREIIEHLPNLTLYASVVHRDTDDPATALRYTMTTCDPPMS